MTFNPLLILILVLLIAIVIVRMGGVRGLASRLNRRGRTPTSPSRTVVLKRNDLLPAPDGFLMRRLFAQGLSEVRRGDWTIADDGTLFTLPLGSSRVQTGRIDD